MKPSRKPEPRRLAIMIKLNRCLRLLAALLSLGAAVALLYYVGLPSRGEYAGVNRGSGLIAAPEIGRLAPAFALPSLSSRMMALEQARGSATILNFWATWCQPCRREMEELQRLYEATPGRLRILALNQGESLEGARAWVDELELTYDILQDRGGTVSRLYQVRGLPTTYLLDEALIVRARVFWRGQPSAAAARSGAARIADLSGRGDD